VLLREFLTLSDGLEARLARTLAVNRTDLDAMELLIEFGPMSPTELARRLQITPAAATLVVDRLVAVGHVDRVPHATDRRAVQIVPRPASVARAMGALMPIIGEVDAVLDRFDDEQRATIERYLESVMAVYRSHVPGSQAPDDLAEQTMKAPRA
jgi:DNA-binding MarR family transcriptional regulator